MKIIFIKDPHLSFGFQNRIRKDYNRDINEKLEFVSNYAIMNGIEHIIFTGDVTDHQYSRGWTFNQFLKNKEVLQNHFVSKGIKIHSIAGNHDFFNGEETIANTVFGELVSSEIINYLTRNPLTVNGLTVCGVDWSAKKEKVISKLEAINKIDGPKVCVLHANVTESESIFTDFTHEFLATVFPNIHVWALGHYHVGHAPKIVQGKLFIDPWNLTRVARDYDVKMDRFDVNFTVLEYTDQLRAYDVEIPHRKFREAFTEDFVNMLQYKKSEVFDFFEKIDIDSVLENEFSDEQMIDKLVKDAGISEAGKNKAINYLNGNE